MMMSQMAAVTAKVVPDTPWLGQGDIEANPRPDPKDSNINETDAATNAPENIAGQETAG
jgi:hypothetical protein